MKLSELYAQVQAALDDVLNYTLFLAAPDSTPGDDADVFLCTIGRVELNFETAEACLFPASDRDDDSAEPLPRLGMVMEKLPFDIGGTNDLRLVVEVPLDRDAAEEEPISLSDLVELYIDDKSREAWLLVRPLSEFKDDDLPA
jgi:hypothetical protein